MAEVAFRTIGELAERCGHYCWLEHRLFELTGRWASAPGAGAADGLGAAELAADAEIRVFLSQMSSWHGFLAGQWHDRLPIRAGVDRDRLVVPPPGGIGEALDLLDTVPESALRLGGLAEPVLTGLLAAYDGEVSRASQVSERPVLGLLELARAHGPTEISAARELAEPAVVGGSEARSGEGAGTVEVSELRARLQRRLGGGRGIFPAARAS